ncbi:MAG: hypothetical protein JWP91_4094 [Fibrobacteres bacterium]|nr:hypothetical protein [Fibrobacterota bacterium]
MMIPAAKPPGLAEGRVHSYLDDARLYVTSVAAAIEYPLRANLSIRAKAVGDWIAILAADAESAPADPHAGHNAGHGDHLEEDDNPIIADAVSGASARVSTSPVNSRETRGEGSVGLVLRERLGNTPATLSADARGSHEPDYSSWFGTLSGQAETFQGNTVISAFVGAGRDRIAPAQAPAGQIGRWPANQSKLSAGFSVAQTMTPRLLVSGGASAGLQIGRLSSPYRNSLVGITYFPEKLPSERLRVTTFAQASWYLGSGAALHLRQGFYADGWGVTAWIPEAALAKELGRALVTAKHRFYAQSGADFYRAVYTDRNGFQTGDLRLGTLYGQTGALELEYRVGRGAGGKAPIILTGEYGISRLEYPDLYPKVLLSHVFTMGVRTEY